MPGFILAPLKNVMRPLHHPLLWLSLWLCAVAGVIIASLAPSRALPTLPHVTDKAEHLGCYALLSLGACMLFCTWRVRATVACGLIILGCVLEVAQGLLTADRTPDIMDALANSIGVVGSFLLGLTPLKQTIVLVDGWLFGQHDSN